MLLLFYCSLEYLFFIFTFWCVLLYTRYIRSCIFKDERTTKLTLNRWSNFWYCARKAKTNLILRTKSNAINNANGCFARGLTRRKSIIFYGPIIKFYHLFGAEPQPHHAQYSSIKRHARADCYICSTSISKQLIMSRN